MHAPCYSICIKLYRSAAYIHFAQPPPTILELGKTTRFVFFSFENTILQSRCWCCSPLFIQSFSFFFIFIQNRRFGGYKIENARFDRSRKRTLLFFFWWWWCCAVNCDRCFVRAFQTKIESLILKKHHRHLQASGLICVCVFFPALLFVCHKKRIEPWILQETRTIWNRVDHLEHASIEYINTSDNLLPSKTVRVHFTRSLSHKHKYPIQPRKTSTWKQRNACKSHKLRWPKTVCDMLIVRCICVSFGWRLLL